METESNMQQSKSEHELIEEQLNRIEKEVKETSRSLAQMRKLMLWRMIFLVAVVLLPLLALPFVLNTFISSYLGAFEGLL